LKNLYFIIFYLFSTFANAQVVVNIESRRLDSRDSGWHGTTEVLFNYSQNTNKVITGGNRTNVIYKKDINSYLFINEYNIIRANNLNFTNNAYQHARYSRKISEILSGEAFAQTQFNQQLGFNFRGLLGAGPRVRLIYEDSIKVFLGPMWMYEHEIIRGTNETNTANRLSTYLSLVLYRWYDVNLDWMIYYQPNLANYDDYRLSAEARLEWKVKSNWLFRLVLTHLYDTDPPKGIPKNISNIRNSLVYSF